MWEVFPQGVGTPFETILRRAMDERLGAQFESPSRWRPDRTVEVRVTPLVTGCTTHIDQRIPQHQSGKFGGYTPTRLPVKVVHITDFQTVLDAIDAERKIKRWSRARKQALIDGRFDDLPGLSLSRWRRGSS